MRTADRLIRLTATTLLLVCSGMGSGCTSREVDAESVTNRKTNPSERIRSVTLSSRNPLEPGTLDSLRTLGVSHVTLIPFGFQRGHDNPRVRFNPDRRWYTESDLGIGEVASAARKLGMETILKPHVWVGGHSTDGQRRDKIGFESEAEWERWEDSYRLFIIHYAGLADRIGADIFVVGTELANAVRRRPNFWRSLIADVRAVYDGDVTYAANWYEEYEDVQFWSDLDFVGVQAYFPLSERSNPSIRDLKSGWRSPRRALARVSKSTERPVFFTEIGYRSIAGAAREPWAWASRDEAELAEPDYHLQAQLYRAFFEEVWEQPWFAGASLWRWHTGSESSGPVRSIDFTPQGKPSKDVIRHWFSSR